MFFGSLKLARAYMYALCVSGAVNRCGSFLGAIYISFIHPSHSKDMDKTRDSGFRTQHAAWFVLRNSTVQYNLKCPF